MSDIKAEYSAEEKAFHKFWYGHMYEYEDMIGSPLIGVSYSQAQYIWDSARSTPKQGEMLSDGVIWDWWRSENGLEDCDMCCYADFAKVVRFVEAKLRAPSPSVEPFADFSTPFADQEAVTHWMPPSAPKEPKP